MAVFPGFIGPAYTERSPTVDAERCVNLYLEKGRGGKTPQALYVVPGLKLWADLGGGQVRGVFAQDGRAWAVCDGILYELQAGGTAINRGDVADDGKPVTMCSNGLGGNQMFIVSGGLGYIFDLTDNTLTQITATGFPSQVAMGAFVDGYFLALIANSASFQISALEDGTSWDASDKGQRSEGSDNIAALFVDHRVVWLLGTATSEVWYNSGATFPFQPIPGAFMEEGCGASFAVTSFDNTIGWIGQSVRGDRMAFRANGYAPQRISTYAVEEAWRGYADISDARGWAEEHGGHTFLVFTFPSAKATWVYDAGEQAWHERGSWQHASGEYHAQIPQCHAYAFGAHLVGARNSGKIYRQSLSLYDDDGDPIRWVRQTTHLCQEQKRMQHHRFQVDLQTGVGLTTGQGSDPQIVLQWSNDGGRTWSNEHWTTPGAIGAYGARAFWYQLGQARDRVYRLSGSDPVFTALAAAYLDVTPGLS